MTLRRLVLLLLVGVASLAPATAGARVPPIKHVFVIVLENEEYTNTFGDNSKAPYLSKTLADRGAFVPGYFGVTHFSAGNYLAMISGQGSNPQVQADCQIYTDFVQVGTGSDGQALGSGCVYPASVRTLPDQLSAKKLTWHGYFEDMKTPCQHPDANSQDHSQSAKVGDQYAARHNPFVYFHSITDSPACKTNVVPLPSLVPDLATASSTPNFTFIVPNLCYDGHDEPCVDGKPGGMVSADAFLKTWIPRIQRSAAYKRDGLIIVAFDEGDSADACCDEPQFPNTPSNAGVANGRGGGQSGAVFLSKYIAPGTISHEQYNHFSFLRSMQDIFGTKPYLGYAGRAGLRSFGSDIFTCGDTPRAVPTPSRGRYRNGTLIASIAVARGTAKVPTLVVTLQRAAKVSAVVARRRVASGSAPDCGVVRLKLRNAHGRATVSAARGRGTEKRTVDY